ncbi:hypothetical protein AAFC00_003904 [Neodothiora populina]|uniref:Amino acid permease/ SLC12A domain-containing protein n=1 Tax=Neodothiora populina TaxID=2781224 RepID=A0ABR3PGY6_9PEZI
MKGSDVEIGESDLITAGSAHLQRKLGGKQVQLFAIGASIGTVVFVSMGSQLPISGPAGLFLAFAIWSMVAYGVNECFAEMVCYAPVPAPFIRFSGEWVDDALGFTQSWVFFFNQVLLIPFEMTAFHRLIGFWTDKLPVEATVFILIFLYCLTNCVSVGWYGQAEFYLSIGKVILIFLCFGFTIVTMLGGNPLHDRYGFRYWDNPGAFAEYLTGGSTGRFLGFLSSLTFATFTVAGPEFIAMVAAETKSPRRILPAAYKSFPFRLLFFFCGSALAVGICIPYNDPTLNAILNGEAGGSGTSAASPYVIAMQRLQISGLPHFFNAVIMTSVFSAGNGYVFTSSRTLYSMALEGRAPKIFTKTLRSGVPIYSVLACIAFCLLALLNVSDNSAKVMNYFVDLVTTNQLLNYMTTCITYVHFYYAMKRQGRSRDSLPYKGIFQPYTAYICIFMTFLMTLLLGFYIFFPGQWDLKFFFLDYTFLVLYPIAFFGWKWAKKTKYHRLGTADLSLGGDVKEIDDYEELTEVKPLTGISGWMERIFGGVYDKKNN